MRKCVLGGPLPPVKHTASIFYSSTFTEHLPSPRLCSRLRCERPPGIRLLEATGSLVLKSNQSQAGASRAGGRVTGRAGAGAESGPPGPAGESLDDVMRSRRRRTIRGTLSEDRSSCHVERALNTRAAGQPERFPLRGEPGTVRFMKEKTQGGGCQGLGRGQESCRLMETEFSFCKT